MGEGPPKNHSQFVGPLKGLNVQTLVTFVLLGLLGLFVGLACVLSALHTVKTGHVGKLFWDKYKRENRKNKNMKETSMNRKHIEVYFLYRWVYKGIHSKEFTYKDSFSYQMFQCSSDPQFLANYFSVFFQIYCAHIGRLG